MRKAAIVVICILIVALLIVACAPQPLAVVEQQDVPSSIAAGADEKLDQNPLDEALEDLEIVE